MADKVTCEGCCFFAPEKGESPTQGECRRRAPMRNWRIGEWPIVAKDDFCGEFLKAAE
jgi:hypothetical protein